MCAMTLATTSAKLLPMRRPEAEKERDIASRSFSFQQNPVYLTIDNLAQKTQSSHRDFNIRV